MDKTEIFIIIAAYNVASQISNVIKELKLLNYTNIVVVDDGSRDNTYDEVKKIKDIFLIKHSINRGQGAALQTGQSFALQKNAKYIVHFDGDGQHNAQEIEKLVFYLKKGFDIALGSRFLEKKASSVIPLKKVIVLKFGIIFTGLISGIWLTDTHNGLRAITNEAAKKIVITMNRYEHASEIIDAVKFLRLKYIEVPVTINYTEFSQASGQKLSNSIRIVLNVLTKKFNDILY